MRKLAIFITLLTTCAVTQAQQPPPALTDQGTLYLAILWHQHQPLYLDPELDQLQGPWVRTHATKDYYDMTAAVQDYPEIHFTVNLTPSLLLQLTEYYVNRLLPFLDHERKRVDADRFLAEWGGRTDPWVDLLLRDTREFGETERGLLHDNPWSCYSIADPLVEKIPRYRELKYQDPSTYTLQDLIDLKGLFWLGYFDRDFLDGPVELADGYRLDLSDLVAFDGDELILRRPLSEADCNRILYESVRIMKAVVPLHRQLMYDPDTHTGQVEVTTTPFYHPILPLIIDSELAAVAQPFDPLPPAHSWPEDARAQVEQARRFYTELFGVQPRGMWPGEGSVCAAMVPLLAEQGFLWFATGDGVLEQSQPAGSPLYYAWGIDGDGGEPRVAGLFRETFLSDLIGFRYKTWCAEKAVDDFLERVLSYAPGPDEPRDRLLTVILDGENAWEWYTEEYDGKGFIHALYRRLAALYHSGRVVTVTPTEYILGNPARGVPPHPVAELPRLEQLWPGSWINASYDTWIGEEEENLAWTLLAGTRADLIASGAEAPDYSRPAPPRDTKRWFELQAWEELYAAEGSDWFWWFGADQTAGEGDSQFEKGFLVHLRNVYRFLGEAGYAVTTPEFPPILKATREQGGQGTMARSLTGVLFQCDAGGIEVPVSLYIVGSTPQLGNWTPNQIALHDDGTHGDLTAGDDVWSLQIRLPIGETIRYKYTNSGQSGVWGGTEEFPGPGHDRELTVDKGTVVLDRYGVLN